MTHQSITIMIAIVAVLIPIAGAVVHGFYKQVRANQDIEFLRRDLTHAQRSIERLEQNAIPGDRIDRLEQALIDLAATVNRHIEAGVEVRERLASIETSIDTLANGKP